MRTWVATVVSTNTTLTQVSCLAGMNTNTARIPWHSPEESGINIRKEVNRYERNDIHL